MGHRTHTGYTGFGRSSAAFRATPKSQRDTGSKIVSGATLLTLLRSCAPPDSRGSCPHVACSAALSPFRYVRFWGFGCVCFEFQCRFLSAVIVYAVILEASCAALPAADAVFGSGIGCAPSLERKRRSEMYCLRHCAFSFSDRHVGFTQPDTCPGIDFPVWTGFFQAAPDRVRTQCSPASRSLENPKS